MSGYNREAAVAYAKAWALKRNPKYLDFETLGGDCTNFASQCLYAGCPEMDYRPTVGWFYRSGNDRTPSWTGVEYLYNFLISPHERGPRGKLMGRASMRPGDIVQLGRADGRFYHSPVIVAVTPLEIFVAAHSTDEWMKPLSTYPADKVRYIKICGSTEC